MDLTHIHRQHIHASAPLPHWSGIGILQGMDYDLFLTRLGAEIKRRREAHEWTQIDFAEKVNTDQGSVSRLERGKQGFDSPLLFRIATTFRTNPGELCSAAVNSPLPSGLPPEAVRVATAWKRLQPRTCSAILEIVDLALKAVPDADVAKHIDPAPTGSARKRPAKHRP